MKILIVEDEFDLAASLARWLVAELYTVEIATSGRTGLEKIMAEKFDAIILDVGLPDMSGFEVCRLYRESGGATPVLILTGKDHINDRIAGLDLGADDYVTKPFSAREISARLRAVLRRPAIVTSNVLKAGSVKLDLIAHRVTVDGVMVNLLPVDYALLECLMRSPNEIFSTENLIAKVWSADKFPTDNAVRSSIKRSRKAIDGLVDGAGSGSIIENVSKAGYRIRQD
jgi:two-component system OmpR family response regulator